MSSIEEVKSAVSGLVLQQQYQEARRHLFPSDSSLVWYIRQHRPALADRGAILLIAGRWHVNADAFDAYVLDTGAAAAKRQAVGA